MSNVFQHNAAASQPGASMPSGRKAARTGRATFSRASKHTAAKTGCVYYLMTTSNASTMPKSEMPSISAAARSMEVKMRPPASG